MIAAVALLAMTGYLVIRRILREPEMLAAISLGLATAWAVFITLLNLALRSGLPFGIANAVAFGVVIVGGVVAALRASPSTAADLDPVDAGILLMLGAPASLLVLLYQFLGADGDNFIHYPLIALFQRGHFPHFNPYFPDVALYGHYGRDLGLAALLQFGGLGIGTAMIVEAWALHVATLANIYFLAKRCSGSRLGAAAAAFLAFFAVNAGFSDWLVRSGLAEVMGNNNPVVYGFVFAILLLAQNLVHRPSWAGVALLGLTVGGMDIVYETHFGLLFGGLAVAAVLLFIGRQAQAARAILTALTIGATVMLLSGGLTSRILRSHLPGRNPPPSGPVSADAWARAGIQQNVEVHFPKHPFLTLTHARDGHPVPVLSREFLRGQGMGLWALPVVALILLTSGETLSVACLSVAIASLLVPAVIDFGRFNGENYRLIFFGGLMAAVCFGIALGKAASFPVRRPLAVPVRNAILTLAVVGMAVTAQRARDILEYVRTLAFTYPHLFRVKEIERLEYFCPEYGAGDEEAAAFVWSHSRREERLLTNYVAPYQLEPQDLVNDAMVVMTSTGLPMPAFDSRVHASTGGIETSVEGWSARTTAFWHTADETILRDIGVDWLYVVPKWLPPSIRTELSRRPAIREVFHTSTGDRLVYRVERSRLPPHPAPPDAAVAGLGFVDGQGLEGGRQEEFRLIDVRLHNSDDHAIREAAYVYYRPIDLRTGVVYDSSDWVGTIQALDLAAGGEQQLRLPFVFPYNEGEHEIQFWIGTATGERRIGTSRITVISPKIPANRLD
jgi:hypothetical protein